MPRLGCILVLTFLAGVLTAAEEHDSAPLVFRSDVSLVRVDVQVVDRENKAIVGLQPGDFVLREGGNPKDIRNFANEDMPLDVLFLLDVSGSMQPHVERLSLAAHEALRVLGPDDRVGVMVFDTRTRVRLPFTSNLDSAESALANVLRQEGFNGGTEITRSILDAAGYVRKEGRRDARRAIVILTDDQTGGSRNEDSVVSALNQADAVLSALLAPDAMRSYGRRGSLGRGGGGWPSGGGGLGGPLGGVIFGGPRRGPYGGRGPMGGPSSGPPVVMAPQMKSAGTAEIAEASGGDSMRVDDASALEITLSRLRQRYALHYNHSDVETAQGGAVEVALGGDASARYPGSEVRYRRVYLSAEGSRAEPLSVSRTPMTSGGSRVASRGASTDSGTSSQVRRRRPAVNEDGTRIDPGPAAGSGGGWRRETDPAPQSPAAGASSSEDPQPPRQGGGWRRVKPGEQP